jgi:hypothetical protein
VKPKSTVGFVCAHANDVLPLYMLSQGSPHFISSVSAVRKEFPAADAAQPASFLP